MCYFSVMFSMALVCLCPRNAGAEDWPQWRGPDRDGVWRETGIIEAFAGPKLDHVWRAEIANGYAGPTVADGRVYVSDHVTEPEAMERVHCFDAATGEPQWLYSYPCVYQRLGYPDGPRAAISIAEGKAYVVGAMGHFHCLDAATGEVIWSKEPGADFEVDVPMWGMASAPLVEGGLVIVQIGVKPDGCVMAFDAQSGAERWRTLSDDTSYSAPILIERAGERMLLCWTGEHLVAIAPTSGEIFWQVETPPTQMVISVPTPVVAGNHLFITNFYDGSALFQLSEDGRSIRPVWARRGENERKTDALHSTISTPLMRDGYIYGVDSYGEFRCLDAATGDRLWEDSTLVPKARWATVHFVQNGNKTWMFNDQGELVIGELSPGGYREISRAKLIDPTLGQLDRGNGVTWAHPAFANKHVFARSDTELVCANLAVE